MPACVRERSRAFTRVVEVNPATTFACSRSITRSSPNARSNSRSRSWITMPFGLLPSIEGLLLITASASLPLLNVAFNVRPDTPPMKSGTVHEVRVIGGGLMHGRDTRFSPTLVNTFHNEVPLREVLQSFRQGFAAIKRLGDLAGVGARKLKEGVGGNREDRGPHLGGILVQELIRRDYPHANLRASERTVSMPLPYATRFWISSQ